ncbi:type II toxin-antitoxin system PemK/MazF family toxin [Clostridium sp.]|uniref:type II toxin-antitoxin system PemK/MazF family toxin n=1 Tax=Clostridium sp. TaxID=1506 RepID=UPI0025C4C85F|nr:type II toxin-antitoxin system PemK/MazF family toxin [Clostridium sp.]
MVNLDIKIGEIFIANLSNGVRPVMILDDIDNSIIKVAIITSNTNKNFKTDTTNIQLLKGECGLSFNITVLLDNTMTINRNQLQKKIGCIPDQYMNMIKK